MHNHAIIKYMNTMSSNEYIINNYSDFERISKKINKINVCDIERCDKLICLFKSVLSKMNLYTINHFDDNDELFDYIEKNVTIIKNKITSLENFNKFNEIYCMEIHPNKAFSLFIEAADKIIKNR